MESKELLQNCGMRITSARLKILELLLSKKTPLSHFDISQAIPEADKVTLYRILSAFAEAGIIHQVHGTDGTARFCVHDASQSGCPGNHAHFLCRICGQMRCIPEQPIPRVNVPSGTVVEGRQLLLFGVCAECSSDE